MKILAVSDVVVNWIYSPQIRQTLSGTELVIGCGDLPKYYLEYIVTTLDIPVFYVHGNHSLPEETEKLGAFYFSGSSNLHCKMKRLKGYTFAGVEGSIRYKEGDYRYSQSEMWLNVIHLVPSLLMNRVKFGRYLDVFITHAPPWGVHDQPDYAHQGIKAFRWLIAVFHPAYHLHGHIHIYRPDTVTETTFEQTRIINVYGYKRIELSRV